MTNDLAIKNNNLEMLSTLRDTVAPGLSNSEFLLFSEMVKATGLNPVTKEIWAIKAGGRLQVMTGINGFLKIANSHPQFDGMEVSHEFDGKNLVSCTVKVHRKDRKFPSIATAYMAEYAKQSPIWKSMPSIMLAKCAKSLAIREAFIQELGGLYTAEEMPTQYAQPTEVVNAETGEITVVETKPKRSRIEKTYYDIRTLPEEQQEKAVEYLKANVCEFNESLGVWICPIRLHKLTSCVVEKTNNEKA
jgi:phage recombination protein Bet